MKILKTFKYRRNRIDKIRFWRKCLPITKYVLVGETTKLSSSTWKELKEWIDAKVDEENIIYDKD